MKPLHFSIERLSERTKPGICGVQRVDTVNTARLIVTLEATHERVEGFKRILAAVGLSRLENKLP